MNIFEKELQINTPLFAKLADSMTQEAPLHVLYEDIKTQLETLFNQRAPLISWPRALTELESSLVNYGLKDFSDRFFDQAQSQAQLAQTLKSLIQRFEPRLSQIHVHIDPDQDKLSRSLSLKIEAKINLSPTPIPAVFISTLDINKHRFDFSERAST